MNAHTDDWRGEHLIRVPRAPKPEPKPVSTGNTGKTRHHGPTKKQRPQWMQDRDARIKELAAQGHGIQAMVRLLAVERPEWRATYSAINNVCQRDEIELATGRRKK